MKLKLTFVAAFAALTINAGAANYLVSNVVTGTNGDVLIQNGNGTLSSGGIVAIGYFSGIVPSSNVANIATTISSFTLQTFSLTGSFSADLEGAFPGYVQGDIVSSALITDPNALIGQLVYLFAGNGATLASSTEWVLAAIRPIADDLPLPQQYTANAAEVQAPLFGNFGTFTGAVNGDSATYRTLQFVPEPSSALLGAIGALALLRRRRA